MITIDVAVTHPGSAIVIGSGLPENRGWQGHIGREDDGRFRADMTESDHPDVQETYGGRDSVGRAGPFGEDDARELGTDPETLGYLRAACILGRLHGVQLARVVVGFEYPRDDDGELRHGKVFDDVRIPMAPQITYHVTLHHVAGQARLALPAADPRAAVVRLLRMEHAPLRSVLKVQVQPTCDYCDQAATRYEIGGQENPLCWAHAVEHYRTATLARENTGKLGITRYTVVPSADWS